MAHKLISFHYLALTDSNWTDAFAASCGPCLNAAEEHDQRSTRFCCLNSLGLRLMTSGLLLLVLVWLLEFGLMVKWSAAIKVCAMKLVLDM